MKHYYSIIIFICFVLMGCGVKKIGDDFLIVKENRINSCKCEFTFEQEYLYFIDTCSKYDVGDTLHLTIK